MGFVSLYYGGLGGIRGIRGNVNIPGSLIEP